MDDAAFSARGSIRKQTARRIELTRMLANHGTTISTDVTIGDATHDGFAMEVKIFSLSVKCSASEPLIITANLATRCVCVINLTACTGDFKMSALSRGHRKYVVSK